MIITILAILSFAVIGFGGFMMGLAVGYGEGYEANMLEDMSYEQKDFYLKNKYLIKKIANDREL